MPKYSINVIKTNDLEVKSKSMGINSKEELAIKFDELITKYNATEDKSRETKVGSAGSYGFFKFATGQCKHNNNVEIQYNEVLGGHTF